MEPEKQARQNIDQLLTAAGWILQDRDQFDRTAGVGVAVREFPAGSGFCDYLLFVDGKAAGVMKLKSGHVSLKNRCLGVCRYGIYEPGGKHVSQAS